MFWFPRYQLQCTNNDTSYLLDEFAMEKIFNSFIIFIEMFSSRITFCMLFMGKLVDPEKI